MIDAHCHLDTDAPDASSAMALLRRDAMANGVEKVFLLNIPGKLFGGGFGFENDDILRIAPRYDGFFEVFPAINPMLSDARETLEAYKAAGASGLKLHPRLHAYHVGEKACAELVAAAGDLNMPVIICAFPDGLSLRLGNDAKSFALLAEAAPDTRIAIGHAGGHHILDFMMVAKAYPNLYLDVSFSPVYYMGSTIPPDIAYAIRNVRGRRVFWGTDYPDRGYAESVRLSVEFWEEDAGLPPDIQMAVFKGNAEAFLYG